MSVVILIEVQVGCRCANLRGRRSSNLATLFVVTFSQRGARAMSALRARGAGRSRQPAKAIAGIRYRAVVATAGILFASTPALSFGGGSSTYPDYLAMLPANVRKVVAGRCGGSAHPHQYFATYFRSSAEMHLHYDRLSCEGPNPFCIARSCLHEVYLLHRGSYTLSRSYYDSADGSFGSPSVAAHR